jgi:hypothetical protein
MLMERRVLFAPGGFGVKCTTPRLRRFPLGRLGAQRLKEEIPQGFPRRKKKNPSPTSRLGPSLGRLICRLVRGVAFRQEGCRRGASFLFPDGRFLCYSCRFGNNRAPTDGLIRAVVRRGA